MRNAVGIFGGLAGAIVVALVSRYGFATSDTALDGAIAAFFFAVIAVGGIGGPAVAVHLFRSASGWGKTWGVIAGVIAGVALLANLSNSLGAIAGRADKTIAERASAKDAAKDARDELKRLGKEREELPAFTPATVDDVQAARDAVAAAERATAAECDKRGPRCRDREGTEKALRDGLAVVLTNRSLTDRAAKIDTDATAARRKIEKAPPVVSVNPMAETLARIFHIHEDDAATWQQVATVIVVELLIAFALIAFELLGGHRKEPAALSLEKAIGERADGKAEPTDVEEPANARSGNTASVGRFMLTCLPRTQGEKASWGAIYARYKTWCSEQDPPLSPLDLLAFGDQFGQLCKRLGIRTRSIRKAPYCLDVRLSA